MRQTPDSIFLAGFSNKYARNMEEAGGLQQAVNAPIEGIENGERGGKDEARVFIDQVDVFDLGHGASAH